LPGPENYAMLADKKAVNVEVNVEIKDFSPFLG
jgi:hypothetical protein